LVDWSNPTRFQLEALHEALLFAYPKPADLNLLLQFRLNKDYYQLAPVGVSYQNGLLDILLDARGGGWLAGLVQKARQHKPDSPKLLCVDRNFELTNASVPTALGRSLEDIVRSEGSYYDLIPWVQKLEELASRTCRIEYPVNTARGTGWLVGADLLLTNWHVIESALPGGSWNAGGFVCRFDYAMTLGNTQSGIEVRLANDWCVDSSPPSSSELGTGNDEPTGETLDFALLRLERPVGQENTATGQKRGWVAVSKDQPLPQDHDIVLVVQHPEGLPVKLAIGDVTEKSTNNLRILHTANTNPGASGSVVVNARLEAIGLHHAGDLLYSKGKIGTPLKNQAVPTSKIIGRLVERGRWS
jgi:hypothetical protein